TSRTTTTQYLSLHDALPIFLNRSLVMLFSKRLLGWLAAGLTSLALATPAVADSAKTLRIGYQKFNSVNILKGTGAIEKALAEKRSEEHTSELQSRQNIVCSL